MGDEHIGARVRRIRLWRGMTQAQVAGLAGWSTSAISMLETGRVGCDRRSRLVQLADALRVSPAELVGQPYPLDAPGLADAQAHVPAVGQALMQHRIGDTDGVEPQPLDELETQVRGPLRAARLRVDDGAVLAMASDLILDLQAYGQDERALRLLHTVCGETSGALKHLGQVPLAWIAAERCGEAAALVGDPVLVAAAEFWRAMGQQAMSARSLARAAGVADRIGDELLAGDRLAQEVYGMLRLTAGLGAQMRGDAAGAEAQASEAAQLAERLGEHPDAWEYFGPANVGTWRTLLAIEAGEPGVALECAAAVDVDSLKPNRRAYHLMDTARAHHQLGRGHDRQVVALIRQAERTAPALTHGSLWVREIIETMLARSRREAGGRELRGLAYRMGLDAV
jgi:transcriptional regulator with XRE-family HTH domain